MRPLSRCRVALSRSSLIIFKKKDVSTKNQSAVDAMEKMFTAIGGLEAQKFGINQGVKNALKAIEADPELVELIKKNSNLGSINITVNQSGSSTDNGESSPPSPSDDVDTTGGLAERHRVARAAYAKAKHANNRAKISALFRAIEQEFLPLSFQMVKNLMEKGSVEYFTITWNLGLFTPSLLEELRIRYNEQTKESPKTDVSDRETELKRIQLAKARVGKKIWEKWQVRIKNWIKKNKRTPRDRDYLSIFNINASAQNTYFKYNNTVLKLKNMAPGHHHRSVTQQHMVSLLADIKKHTGGWQNYAIWLSIGKGKLL